MEKIEFSGYEPRPVLASKMAQLVKIVEELQIEVAKLKLAAESTKKSAKKTEE